MQAQNLEPYPFPFVICYSKAASSSPSQSQLKEWWGEKQVPVHWICCFHVFFFRPKNGGKYCVGRRMKFKSCNTEPCLNQKRDFREEQCAHFDGKHFNINGLLPSVRWVPKYSGSKCSGAEACGCQAGTQSRHGSHRASWSSSLVLMKDRCKLFCRVAGNTAYYQLRDRVIDGTPCGQDTNDICVQGLCRVSPRGMFFTELSCYLIDVCLP